MITPSNLGNHDSEPSRESPLSTENSKRNEEPVSRKTDASDQSYSDTSGSSDSVIVSRKRTKEHGIMGGVTSAVAKSSDERVGGKLPPRTEESDNELSTDGSESTDSITVSRKRSVLAGERDQSNENPEPPPAQRRAPGNEGIESDSSDSIALSRKRKSNGRSKHDFNLLDRGGMIDIATNHETNGFQDALDKSRIPEGAPINPKKVKHTNKVYPPQGIRKGKIEKPGDEVVERTDRKPKAVQRKKGPSATDGMVANSHQVKPPPTSSSLDQTSGNLPSSTTAENPDSARMEAMINARRKALLAQILVESGGALAAMAGSSQLAPTPGLTANRGTGPMIDDAAAASQYFNAIGSMYPRQGGMSMVGGSLMPNHSTSSALPYPAGIMGAGVTSAGNGQSRMIDGSQFDFSGPTGGVSDLSRFGMQSTEAFHRRIWGERPMAFSRPWPVRAYDDPTIMMTPTQDEATRLRDLGGGGVEAVTMNRHRPTLHGNLRHAAAAHLTHHNLGLGGIQKRK